MISLIRTILQQWLNDIDAGNSNLSQKEEEQIIDLYQKVSQREYSKTTASEFIGVSKATFDKYITKGLIPKGEKTQGFTELSWRKKDLLNYLKNKNYGNDYK